MFPHNLIINCNKFTKC